MEFRHFLHEGRTERRSLSQFAPRLPGAPQMAFMPLIVFLAVAFMIFGRGAAAAPITIEFQGAVSEIISYDAPDVACPGCAVPIGTEVIGRFSFTPNPAALNQVLPGATFEFIAGSFSRSISNLAIEIPQPGDSAYSYERYRAMAQQYDPNPFGGEHLFPEQFGVQLTGSMTPFSTSNVDQIPALGAGDFFFNFTSDYGPIEFRAALTELVPVPEPSSAILLGTAIVSAMLLSGFQRPVLPEPVRREQGYLEATS